MGGTALLIIDMQKGMEERIASGRETVNPGAAAVIARLAADFRSRGLPVIHVRHHDRDPASPFRAGCPAAEPMDCDLEVPGEAVFIKSTSSAFASTGLEAHLRDLGIARLVVCGAVAAFCVSSAVRDASDRGFAVSLVPDALMGFDLPDGKGGRIAAQPLFDAALAVLAADFAQVTDEAGLIAGLRS